MLVETPLVKMTKQIREYGDLTKMSVMVRENERADEKY